MLHLLDNLLRHLFMTQIDEITDASQIGFQPPDENWRSYVATLNVGGQPANALNVYLFALNEHRALRSNEKIRSIENGMVNQKPMPFRMECHYRITDFGPAQAMAEACGKEQILPGPVYESDNLHRTQLSHGVVGTPAYMAPEQWWPGKLTAATDIYAFGCIMYEMLTGRMAQVRTKDGYELNLNLPVDLSSVLKTFLLRCLEHQPEKRFTKWSDATEALGPIYTTITGKAFEVVPVDDKATREERLACGYSFNAIGKSYFDIGKFSVARGYFERVLDTAQTEQDHSLEGIALNNLGSAYRQLGDARAAIGHFEQHLVIAREIGDRHGEGVALGSLGNAYFQLGDARAAIGYIERHLAIAREIGDRNGEGQSLGNLGSAYFQLGDTRAAIRYFEQNLAIAREIGDVMGVALTGFNLAKLLMQQRDFPAAQTYARAASEFFS